MKKSVKSILWGLLFVFVGVIFALKVLGFKVEILFDGWWTLFIIIPCAIELFTNSNKIASTIGLLFGIALLLAARDIITYSMIWKLILPIILVVIGIYIIYRSFIQKKPTEQIPEKTTASTSEHTQKGKSSTEYSAAFSSETVNFDGQIFTGTALNAIFGSVTCDLRTAIIEEDVTINATTVFGGIDILLPANVRVRVKSSSFFGDVDNRVKYATDVTAPNVHIDATCIFGGIDVK